VTALEQRVADLELAVLQLAAGRELEFGDTEGHPFHGNQWSQRSSLGEAAAVGKSVADKAAADRHAAAGTHGSAEDHVVKGGRTDASIVEAAKAKGLWTEKPLTHEAQKEGFGHGYGYSHPAAVLPTNTRIDLRDPNKNEYSSQRHGDQEGSIIVTYNHDTSHLRALGTAGDTDASVLGNRVMLQHDQTGRSMGADNTIVGIRHADGSFSGMIPARSIPYAVFK
jgi:hypothetical protein